MILGVRHEYFRCLLFGGLRESNSNSVELGDDTPLNAFEAILRYVYTGKIEFRRDQTEDQIIEILVLAHTYGMKKLQIAIVDFIVESLLKEENALKFYQFNDVYQFEKMKEACEELIDNNPSQVLQTPGLHLISPKIIHGV